jgi:hypothetical protein
VRVLWDQHADALQHHADDQTVEQERSRWGPELPEGAADYVFLDAVLTNAEAAPDEEGES